METYQRETMNEMNSCIDVKKTLALDGRDKRSLIIYHRLSHCFLMTVLVNMKML